MATNWCEIQPKYPLEINQDDISLLQFLGQEFLWNLYKNVFFSGQVFFYLSLDWLEIQDTASVV